MHGVEGFRVINPREEQADNPHQVHREQDERADEQPRQLAPKRAGERQHRRQKKHRRLDGVATAAHVDGEARGGDAGTRHGRPLSEPLEENIRDARIPPQVGGEQRVVKERRERGGIIEAHDPATC